jgi:hypothetical protein
MRLVQCCLIDTIQELSRGLSETSLDNVPFISLFIILLLIIKEFRRDLYAAFQKEIIQVGPRKKTLEKDQNSRMVRTINLPPRRMPRKRFDCR